MEVTVNGMDWKIARIRKGLRQFEVARVLGISQPGLSQLESGYREMPPAFKEKLHRLYEMEKEEGAN